MGKIILTGINNELSIQDILDIAENYTEVALSENAREKIISGRRNLESQLKDHPEIPIYGTNVLHGDLKDIKVNADIVELYQEKYIKVHNCGTGNPLPNKVVRAMMVIRLNSFARGLSGMRIETCDMLTEMLKKMLLLKF